MTVDSFKTVNWNDGEDITYGDLGDMSRFVQAIIWDKIIGNLIGNVKNSGALIPDLGGNNGVDAPTHLAYALHGGSAYVRPGSTANKVQIAPGVLMQKVANQTGNEQTLLAYAFAGTEEVAIAAGDAVNPRIDLIQMQLSLVSDDLQSRDFQDAVTGANTSQNVNKKRQVQYTLSVKQGAAAVSPVTPDPDAGFVAVASVCVLANYATTTALQFGLNTGNLASANAFVMDQRMPVNVQGQVTDPQAMRMKTAWALDTTGSFFGEDVKSTNATNEIRIPSAKGGRTSRLVAISLWGSAITDSASNQFQQIVAEAGFPIVAAINKVPVGLAGGGRMTIPYYTIDGSYTDVNSSVVIQPSVTNKIGVPVWSNGCFAPFVQGAATSSGGEVQFVIVSGQLGSIVQAFTWHWAEGI